MLVAKKENKQYKVDETTKKTYLARGFDIYEEGKLLEKSPISKISYAEHKKILKEAVAKALENVGKASASDHLKGMDVEALKNYALERGIDIGNATSVEGITKKIKEAEAQ